MIERAGKVAKLAFSLTDEQSGCRTRISMTEDAKAKRETEPRTIMLDPHPKRTMKAVAGADHDEWNLRQANLVLAALPGKRDDETNMLFGVQFLTP
jgi:hypothetical protein